MRHQFKTPWYLSDTFFSIFFVVALIFTASLWLVLGYGAYSVISAGPEGIGKAVGEAVRAYKDTAQ